MRMWSGDVDERRRESKWLRKKNFVFRAEKERKYIYNIMKIWRKVIFEALTLMVGMREKQRREKRMGPTCRRTRARRVDPSRWPLFMYFHFEKRKGKNDRYVWLNGVFNGPLPPMPLPYGFQRQIYLFLFLNYIVHYHINILYIQINIGITLFRSFPYFLILGKLSIYTSKFWVFYQFKPWIL